MAAPHVNAWLAEDWPARMAAAAPVVAAQAQPVRPSDGAEGNDTIFGTGGADWLRGNGGNDDMRASGGNDTLDGGAGDDRLRGFTGSDLLIGGEGSDLFYFQADTSSPNRVPNFNGPPDSLPSNPDLIADFVQGEDRIQLAFPGINHVEHRYEGSETVLTWFTFGGQIGEVRLTGLHALTGADLILG